jgi:hypothetical protein
MQVFVAIWEDRHSDTEAKVFSTEEKAVEWAKRTVKENDRHDDLDETLNESMKEGGWVYYGRYSCEGDHIHVMPVTIDEP